MEEPTIPLGRFKPQFADQTLSSREFSWILPRDSNVFPIFEKQIMTYNFVKCNLP